MSNLADRANSPRRRAPPPRRRRELWLAIERGVTIAACTFVVLLILRNR